VLTFSVLAFIAAVGIAIGISLGIAFAVCISLKLLLILLAFILAIIQPIICSVLLIAVLYPAVPETPVDQVLTDEDHALDALVRGPLLLARVVYDQPLLLGQERRRSGQ
jgi:hypothetical protein